MIALRYHARMAKLMSELEVTCPCCQAALLIDTNLGRVISHREQAARREAMFQQSVAAERGRGDALAKRFEEALKQAKTEPITKPTRDFDLD